MSPVRNNQVKNYMFVELSREGAKEQIERHVTDVFFEHVLFLTG